MADTKAQTEESPKQTFKGSCHCKAIQYEVKLAIPDPPTVTRCNCTVCLKTGFTGITIKPEDLTMISPASLDDIPDYSWRSPNIHRRFCNKCGVQIVGHGFYEHGGQKFDFFSLNAGSLDQPQEGLDLSKFKVKYASGRDDGWMKGPKEEPFSGGLI
jgi:hypothetical protein